MNIFVKTLHHSFLHIFFLLFSIFGEKNIEAAIKVTLNLLRHLRLS